MMRSLKTKSAVRKQSRRQWAQAVLLSSLVAQLIFGYTASLSVAQAQSGPLKTDAPAVTNIPVYNKGVDQGIEQYLCTPTDANLGRALYECIGKVYRFGIAFGAIAVVFFVIYAGYLYMVGGEATKEKGKGVFLSALTGMAIILSSYVLLNFINPDLVKIKPIQAPIFTAADLAKCADVGFGVTCVLPSGQVGTGGGGEAGSASEEAVKPLISKYAAANGLEYCQLSALIQKESTFITNAVSNGPPHRVDINNKDKYYGLPFTRAYPGSSQIGHGIGLAQVFIYGPPPHRSWANTDTPSRDGKEFGFSKPLTIVDLINPDIAVSAAAHFFAGKVKGSGGNIGVAYGKYYGEQNAELIRKMLLMYEACKKRGN